MGKDTTEKLKKYIKEDRPSRFNSFVRKRAIDACDVQLNKKKKTYCIMHVHTLVNMEGILYLSEIMTLTTNNKE